MKKLAKPILFSPLFISGLALVSCTVGTTDAKEFEFDGNKDGELQFVTSWNEKQPRFQALDQVVKLWNSKPEVQDQNNREYLPIKLTPNYDKDYTEMTGKITQIFSAKDRNQALNLVINYPSVAANAAKYKMLLDLNKFPDLAQAIKDTYHPKFLESNTQIATLDEKGIYTIPFVKSSQTLVINGPIMAWIIENAKKNGAKIADSPADKRFFEQFSLPESDKEHIQKLWKPRSFDDKNPNPWQNFELSHETFEYYDKVFDFSKRIKQGFVLKPADISSGDFPFGTDDIENLAFAKIFASAGGDYSNFMFEVTREKSKELERVSFDKLFNKNSQSYQNTKKNYEQILDLFKSDAIFYPGRFSQESFANNLMNNHQLAMAISSTSNYQRRFVKSNSNFVFQVNGKTEKIPFSSNIQAYQIRELDPGQKDSQKAIYELKNVLTNQISHLINETKSSTYADSNVYLDPADTSQAKKVKEFVDSNSKNSSQSYLVFGDGFYKFYQEKIKTTDSEIINLTNKNDKNDIFLLKNASIENPGGDKHLNQNEVVFLQEPIKNSSSDPKSIFTYQGPNLIAFHSNEEEDIATKNFLKWMLTHKQDFTYQDQSGEAKYHGSPSEYVAFRGNYLAPTKQVFGQSLANTEKFQQNNSFRTAFKNFKTVNDDPENNSFYMDPVDSRSALIRQEVKTTLNQMGRLVVNGSQNQASFEKFLTALQTKLNSANVS
ncbi:P68 family surface lipoprotein [Mesomycoplasma ovipneumoniae]|uniref:P68 family surface lipoprotein n=1 Tax=Mesomycoplasma ovipneumoniae TaxID=29562 RepID=UPI002963CD40|nr:P80 family lipoprotein [Mesomycoplasma ovipneumoniae]MDW2834016.1 P80 family lipoprotein [Mesomycoplasma ovipneumoniae]